MDPERVVIVLDSADPSRGSTVLAAGLSLFYGDVELVLVLAGVQNPTPEQGQQVLDLCVVLAGDAPLPDIVLLGESEAAGCQALLTVRASDEPTAAAESIVLLSSVALRRWAAEAHAQEPGGGARAVSEGAQFLESRDAIIRQRDAMTPPGTTPVVVVVAQVQSTWGAVEPVCAQLAARDDVRLEIVAVESEHDVRATSTLDFVRSQGYEPRDAQWLGEQYANPASGVALALFYDPWDGLRPEEVRSSFAAEHGVRVVYFPYSPNAAAGDKMESMSYDLPMHRLAWRIYARSGRQRELFRRHCLIGADQVRVAGTPKIDRIVAAVGPVRDRDWSPAAHGRTTILWNPHFSMGEGGWSTFLTYVQPMLDYAAAHPDLFLLIRPHFRILRDLELAGEEGRKLAALLTDAEQAHENIAVDRSPDYLEAFAASDAMVTDLSSLLTEYFVTGRPILYLHRDDGPGINDDAEYFLSCDVADDWSDVQRFLELQVRLGDTGAARRRLARARSFDMEDGRSAERIVDDLLGGLTAERGHLTSQVRS